MPSEMCIIDHTGDTKLIWNSDNKDEVEAAKDMFDKLKKKGYIAFSVKANGDKGDALTKFDPDAEKIIMAPPAVGG